MKSKQWIGGIFAVFVLTLLDLLTKQWAATALLEKPLVIISNVFELRYLENHGAAFGILQNQQWFFYLITIVFLGMMLFVYGKIPQDRHYALMRVICIVLTSGAIGNFIDRLTLHYVRDFLYFSLIDFPIFNVADIYVTCAAIALFLAVLFFYKDEDFDFLKRKEGA